MMIGQGARTVVRRGATCFPVVRRVGTQPGGVVRRGAINRARLPRMSATARSYAERPMGDDRQYPRRRPLRLRGYDYAQPGGYCVTITVDVREYIRDNPAAASERGGGPDRLRWE
jgi:hypothetical protein